MSSNSIMLANQGLTGLGNLGNTCYINSCMQILNNIPALNEYIKDYLSSYDFDVYDYNILFLREWIGLHELMWKKNCRISPNRFIKVIKIIAKNKNRDEFTGFEQNDVSEFLYFLLECFHDGLTIHSSGLFDKMIVHIRNNYTKQFTQYFLQQFTNKYSFIELLFSIVYKVEIVEKSSGKIISTRYENNYTIDVALTDTDLDKCLDNHFCDETMDGENQYYDDKTESYKDVIKRTNIEMMPNILIIQLKRWNFNLRKNQRVIHFDEDGIDISQYKSLSCPTQDSKYSLFGIVNHSGNVFGGHYTSCVRNMNGKWYDFNDTDVKEHKGSVKGNKNYVLIYRKN
jgi:ubiquitin C-terminal hydrolase